MNAPRAIYIYIYIHSKVASSLKSFDVSNLKQSLIHSERRALNELRNNRDIVIKEADKGGTVCIMDRSFYCQKIKDMLQEHDTYQLIHNDQVSPTMNKIADLLKQHPNTLTDKEIDYLCNFETKISNLYGLPKVHKSDAINNAIRSSNTEYISILAPDDLTFRPIVAGPVCPTSRLSHIIDILIKPLQEVTKSYVRDDIDFLVQTTKKC